MNTTLVSEKSSNHTRTSRMWIWSLEVDQKNISSEYDITKCYTGHDCKFDLYADDTDISLSAASIGSFPNNFKFIFRSGN